MLARTECEIGIARGRRRADVDEPEFSQCPQQREIARVARQFGMPVRVPEWRDG